jgi:hypothetical protein
MAGALPSAATVAPSTVMPAPEPRASPRGRCTVTEDVGAR